MDNMQSGINSILENPEMMQKIMSMAQSFSGTQQQAEPAPQPPPFDPAMLQKISGLMGQTGIDPNQKGLLSALRPYLSCYRLDKLEKAMRAAKMAKFASGLFGR